MPIASDRATSRFDTWRAGISRLRPSLDPKNDLRDLLAHLGVQELAFALPLDCWWIVSSATATDTDSIIGVTQETRALFGRIAVSLGIGALVTAAVYAFSTEPYGAVSGFSLALGSAALVMALFIYQLQEATAGESHRRLLEQFEAQETLLSDLADQTPPDFERSGPDARLPEALTDDQRAAVERRFGPDSIQAAWKTGAGKGNRPRLVRLADGRLVSVYSGGRVGGTYVREVRPMPIESGPESR